MYHSIFICSIFLTIIATTFSSDIKLETDKDDQTTPRITTISPDLPLLHKEPEPDAKLHEEPDLEIVVPTTEDQDELEYSSPKSKRCKLSTRTEIASKNNHEIILKSKNVGNFRNTRRRVKNSLLSKTPNTAEDSDAIRRTKDISCRDNDLLKLLRLHLIKKYSKAGAPPETLMPNLRVMENDNFVCYCLAKKPHSTKHTYQNTDSYPQLSMKRYNVAKNKQNKNPIVTSRQFKNPTQKVDPQTIPNQFYPHDSQHWPNYYTNNFHSLLPRRQDTMPYIPYIYGADPRFPKLSTVFPGKLPPHSSIPFNSVHRIPDSIVGAPTVRKESCNKNRPPKKPHTVMPNEIIVAENTPNHNYLSPTKGKSITDFANEVANKFKTTGRKILDYFDMKNVKSPFTSEPSIDQIGRGSSDFDESYKTSSKPINAYPGDNGHDNVNLQSRLNIHTEDSMGHAQTECNRNDAVGESNLYMNSKKFKNDDLNRNVGSIVDNAHENENNRPFEESCLARETTKSIIRDSTIPKESIPTAEIDDEDPLLGTAFSAEDDVIESPNIEENSGLLESSECDTFKQSIGSEEEEEEGVISDMTITEDFINANTQSAGAKHRTTIQIDNEDDTSIVESTRKSFTAHDTVGAKNPSSDQSMPFCDNTLLQKTIKAVINNFATGDSEVNEETVGSPMGEDLLPEIVKVPNLKGILSMPPIELTILDKVKNLLSSITGVQRENFDSDWPTDVIRNTLHHTLSAAPKDDTDPSPIMYKERQFKDGMWITGMATLQPTTIKESRNLSDMDKLRASVQNLLRNPNIDMNAANNPVVQNMIVQSIQNFLKPENTPGKKCFDRSVIMSTLNNELSNMEMENAHTAMAEYEHETTMFDTSNSNIDRLLNIAKMEAGATSKKGSKSLDPEEITLGTTQSLNYDSVKASRDHAYSGTSKAPTKVGIRKFKLTTSSIEEPSNVGKYISAPTESSHIEAAVVRNRDESRAAGITDYEYTEHIRSATDPIENTRTTSEDKVESKGELVRMENEDLKRKPYAHDTFDSDAFAYLGKISIKNKDNTDNLQNLRNSELFYIGDGVQLPLEIRKLRDGTYILSISRKICQHLLNKECPCCVPENGKIVRTVKNPLERKNSDRTMKMKRISKRELPESILPNERREHDLADDNLKVLSMPVESFAKRYNLSLSLGKMHTPRNFEKENINGHSKEQQASEQNKGENNSGADLLYNAPVHPIWKNIKRRTPITKKAMTNNNYDERNYKYQEQKQRDLEKFRYQRNIDKSTNTRSAIVKNVLNLIRDIMLNIHNP